MGKKQNGVDTIKSDIKPGKDFIGLAIGAVILDEREKILLIKRKSNTDKNKVYVGEGIWSTVGGKVDFGESIEDALKREVKEEIGIEPRIEKFIGYSEQILENGSTHWFLFHFLCRIDEDPKIMEPEKIEKIEWFDINNLPENTIFEHVIRPLKLLGYMKERR